MRTHAQTHNLTVLSHHGVYIRTILGSLHSLILKLITLALITLSTPTVYPWYVICSCLSLLRSVLRPHRWQRSSATEANCANSLVWEKKESGRKIGMIHKSVG